MIRRLALALALLCAPLAGHAQDISAPGATPGGANTQVQFNDSGAFGGSAGLTYNKATSTLTAGIYGTTSGYYTVGTTIGVGYQASNEIEVNSTGAYSWSSGTGLNVPDIYLRRDAANALAQRNGTNAQTFNLYQTYTDASNYARLGIQVSGGAALIQGQSAGTGGNVDLFLNGGTLVRLATGGTDRWKIDGSGHFIANADNTYDIGASGANRPRNVYVAGTGTFAGNVATNRLTASEQIVRKGYTVVGLPTGVIGGMAYVTDAVACTFLATPTGGGSTFCPVIYSGAAWLAE